MDSEEPAAKVPKVEKSFKLTVQLASGGVLASVEAIESCTVEIVRKSLLSFMQPGTELSSLLYDTQILEMGKTLAEYGLADNAVLSAVVVGVPTLHLFVPCSSSELGGTSWENPGRRDFWNCWRRPIALPDVQHRPMQDAPQAAKEVAEALNEAFPGLGEASSSDGDDGGEVVVIANPGKDAKSACMKALAICSHVEEGGETFGPLSEHIEFIEKDWSAHSKCGFNLDPEREDEPNRGIVAVTKIMSERLTKGFMFTFDDELSIAPMLFGGYASDGSIVGVLTSRVW